MSWLLRNIGGRDQLAESAINLKAERGIGRKRLQLSDFSAGHLLLPRRRTVRGSSRFSAGSTIYEVELGLRGKVKKDLSEGVLGEGGTECVTGAVDHDMPDAFARLAPA